MKMNTTIKYLQFQILKTTEPNTHGTIYHATYDGLHFMSELSLARLKKILRTYV